MMALENTRCREKEQQDTKVSTHFNMCIVKPVKVIKTNPGGTIFSRLTQHLAYASEDVKITARTLPVLAHSQQEFEGSS